MTIRYILEVNFCKIYCVILSAINIISLDSTKLKIIWIKIVTFFKRHVSIIL